MGMGELLLILVVALLVVGPDKLPTAAKAIGKGIRDFRRHTLDLQSTIEKDEHIGGAMRELRSALRDDPAPRPTPAPAPAAGDDTSDSPSLPSSADGDRPAIRAAEGTVAQERPSPAAKLPSVTARSQTRQRPAVGAGDEAAAEVSADLPADTDTSSHG